jgi:Flp pilus assembly protein TadG
MNAPKRPERRRGAAAVEFAIVFALLLLPLLIGLWEMSRLVEVQQLVANAAREAARQASTGTKTTTAEVSAGQTGDIENAALNYLRRAGLDTTGATVTVTNLNNGARTPKGANQMDHLRVTVSLPFANVRWVALDQITTATAIEASADWFSMKDIPLDVSSSFPIE